MKAARTAAPISTGWSPSQRPTSCAAISTARMPLESMTPMYSAAACNMSMSQGRTAPAARATGRGRRWRAVGDGRRQGASRSSCLARPPQRRTEAGPEAHESGFEDVERGVPRRPCHPDEEARGERRPPPLEPVLEIPPPADLFRERAHEQDEPGCEEEAARAHELDPRGPQVERSGRASQESVEPGPGERRGRKEKKDHHPPGRRDPTRVQQAPSQIPERLGTAVATRHHDPAQRHSEPPDCQEQDVRNAPDGPSGHEGHGPERPGPAVREEEEAPGRALAVVHVRHQEERAPRNGVLTVGG